MAPEKTSVPVLNFQDFITVDGDQLVTTSQKVAAVFGKKHKVVLTAIRELLEQLPADRRHNFEQTVEMRENPSGGAMIPSISFNMTRDGFTWLGMRFRGTKALVFQIAYTDAFNAMAAYIRNQRDGLRFRCDKLELEVADSKRRGSIHGKGLRERGIEKLVLDPELEKLKALVQPSLIQ